MDTQIITATRVESKPQIFTTYEDSFALWLANLDRSDRTIKLYKTGLADFRAWFERGRGKDLEPALITPLDVKAYRRYLQEERQLTPNSINSYLAALRAFCRWALEQELIMRDPSREIKGIKLNKPRPRWLERQEQYKVLVAAEERVQLAELKFKNDLTAPAVLRARRDCAIIVLMLDTGLRLAEVAGLRLGDMVIQPRSGWVTVIGKGQKAREVKLSIDARKALTAWLDVRGGERHDPVFISQKGAGAMTARAIALRVEKIGKHAGVELTPHMLRHSMAKNMVDSGIQLDRVQSKLGHASMGTTARYTMPSDADEQADAERLAWRN